MAGITDANRDKALSLIKEMAKEMSPTNRDGCGYAAIDNESKLFGERWLDNDEAFSNTKTLKSSINIAQFGDAIDNVIESSNESLLDKYNKFGDVKLDKITAITLHTRMATSAKGMMNTHPFYYPEDDTSLIHNGVIINEKDFKLKVSTCDSEAILQAYLSSSVNKYPIMIGEMAKILNGYYAVGMFSRDEEGNRILDVFKGNHASLIVTYIYDLDTYVFTTSEYDVSSACRKLNLTMDKAFTIKEGHLLRLDPFTSKISLKEKFTVPTINRTNYYNNYDSYHSNNNKSWSNNNTKNEFERSSNIIDVSITGAKERSKKTKSVEEIYTMMTLLPGIKEYSDQEVRELGVANNWWSKE